MVRKKRRSKKTTLTTTEAAAVTTTMKQTKKQGNNETNKPNEISNKFFLDLLENFASLSAVASHTLFGLITLLLRGSLVPHE